LVLCGKRFKNYWKQKISGGEWLLMFGRTFKGKQYAVLFNILNAGKTERNWRLMFPT